MARYFFRLSHQFGSVDDDGLDFDGIDGARHEALSRAAEFASDVDNLEAPGAIVVTVRDSARNIVLTVRLVCSVETNGPG